METRTLRACVNAVLFTDCLGRGMQPDCLNLACLSIVQRETGSLSSAD